MKNKRIIAAFTAAICCMGTMSVPLTAMANDPEPRTRINWFMEENNINGKTYDFIKNGRDAVCIEVETVAEAEKIKEYIEKYGLNKDDFGLFAKEQDGIDLLKSKEENFLNIDMYIRQFMTEKNIDGYSYFTEGNSSYVIVCRTDEGISQVKAFVKEKGYNADRIEYKFLDLKINAPEEIPENLAELAVIFNVFMKNNGISGTVEMYNDVVRVVLDRMNDQNGRTLAYFMEQCSIDKNKVIIDAVSFDMGGGQNDGAVTPSFTSKVMIMDLRGNSLLVKPVHDDPILSSASRLFLSPKAVNTDDVVLKAGMTLDITHDGGILETYPAQFAHIENVVVSSDTAETVRGDANCDNKVDISDAVLIMQSIANPGRYGANGSDVHYLTELGRLNADITGSGDGVTNLDALEIQKILLGLDKPEPQSNDSAPASAAPTSSVKVALKCKAFIPSNEKLDVDVAMLGIPTQSFYDDDSFVYYYTIYPYDNMKKIEDERLTVNGEAGGYIKEYTGKNRNIFNAGIEYDDYDTYHHETASLDFSRYPAGSTGSIVFGLKAVFLNDDGTRPENPSTVGGADILYFCVGEDGVGLSNTSIEAAKEAYMTQSTDDVTPPDTYTGRWHGKNISYDLYKALKAHDGKTISVMFSLKDDPDSDNYVYNGRTIKEYKQDTMGEDLTKMENLLNSIYGGDQLKYGEIIYTSGTPDGTKWTKEIYDITVESYGEELLSKYIVDGEFLKEQLAADLKALKLKYQAALNEAVNAYEQFRIDETIKQLEAQGIRSERTNDPSYIVMYVTAEQLDALSLDNASYFTTTIKNSIIF